MKTGITPIHTVYGGAHLFRPDTCVRFGAIALDSLKRFAADGPALSRAIGIETAAEFATDVYARVIKKLENNPVEDLRIDFEDGLGVRSPQEEDDLARATARVFREMETKNSLPHIFGIRVKGFGDSTRERSIRTMQIFLDEMKSSGSARTGDVVLCLPKISRIGEVQEFERELSRREENLGLAAGTLRMEIMIESAGALFDQEGRFMIPLLVKACSGRCLAMHFGAYDFTSELNISSLVQRLTHPACDFARFLMQTGAALGGVRVVDSITNSIPVGPHRQAPGASLTESQKDENLKAVHMAWQHCGRNIFHALVNGIHQGWDLHPAHLPVRYFVTYLFFRQGFQAEMARLEGFLKNREQAVRSGVVFDDQATLRGVCNYLRMAVDCGAVDASEIAGRTHGPEVLSLIAGT